jgi:hypothetical protein
MKVRKLVKFKIQKRVRFKCPLWLLGDLLNYYCFSVCPKEKFNSFMGSSFNLAGTVNYETPSA